MEKFEYEVKESLEDGSVKIIINAFSEEFNKYIEFPIIVYYDTGCYLQGFEFITLKEEDAEELLAFIAEKVGLTNYEFIEELVNICEEVCLNKREELDKIYTLLNSFN